MKHLTMLICCMSIGTFITAKVMLISPYKRTTVHQTDGRQEETEQLLTSYKECTVLLEMHTPEEALEMLSYLPTLKHRNKTIICKAPEKVVSLLTWSPYIDQITTSDTTESYAMKLTREDLELCVTTITNQHSQSAPLIMVDKTAAALWQETFAFDTNFKIGIYCEPLQSSCITTKHKITSESFFPLALLHNVSIYSFDTLTQDTTPEHITIYHFEKQAKKSLAHVAALIHHMDLIITTQPTVAYIAEILHKTAWLIVSPETDTQKLLKAHPQIEIFAEPTDERLLCAIIRRLSRTVIKPASELITAEIAIGELIDKITILEIKAEQICDEEKLRNIYRELESLQRTCDAFITPHSQLQELTAQLKKANLTLWITEDFIRDKERNKCFDEEFIRLARSVYIQNDERCRVKRSINELLGSRLIEEKSYKPYN